MPKPIDARTSLPKAVENRPADECSMLDIGNHGRL
jgi:hypothetical protein